jgi:hypothetical protein
MIHCQKRRIAGGLTQQSIKTLKQISVFLRELLHTAFEFGILNASRGFLALCLEILLVTQRVLYIQKFFFRHKQTTFDDSEILPQGSGWCDICAAVPVRYYCAANVWDYSAGTIFLKNHMTFVMVLGDQRHFPFGEISAIICL